MKLWIARDKDGELFLYIGEKPFMQEDSFYLNNINDYYIPLNNELFPSVTFENSPQQVELKLCNTDFDRIIEENKDVLKRIKENGD